MSGAQTVLAFDFGLKRIGIASGDTVSRSAAPRPAVRVGRAGPDWERIGREVSALGPGLLIVGAPRHSDGSEGALSAAVRRFAAELERRFQLPVQLIDERYSSLEAAAQLKTRRAAGERRRRVQRADIDSAAAVVILTRFLTGDEARGR
jgi:putative Holliday junction resolvase